MRHGNGRFESDAYSYVGSWAYDMKHGRGRYQVRDSDEVICGTFMHDELNGTANVGGKTVLFQNNMQVLLT